MRRSPLAWMALALLGCGAAAPPPARPGPIRDLASLVEALRGAGAEVQLGPETMQRFMPVPARLVAVDGEAVQVFELPDEESARVLAARIAPDASSVGRATVAWSGPAHFFRAGRTIVLYVGEDPAVVARLASVLGDPIAIGNAKRESPEPDDWVPTTRA